MGLQTFLKKHKKIQDWATGSGSKKLHLLSGSGFVLTAALTAAGLGFSTAANASPEIAMTNSTSATGYSLSISPAKTQICLTQRNHATGHAQTLCQTSYTQEMNSYLLNTYVETLREFGIVPSSFYSRPSTTFTATGQAQSSNTLNTQICLKETGAPKSCVSLRDVGKETRLLSLATENYNTLASGGIVSDYNNLNTPMSYYEIEKRRSEELWQYELRRQYYIDLDRYRYEHGDRYHRNRDHHNYRPKDRHHNKPHDNRPTPHHKAPHQKRPGPHPHP